MKKFWVILGFAFATLAGTAAFIKAFPPGLFSQNSSPAATAPAAASSDSSGESTESEEGTSQEDSEEEKTESEEPTPLYAGEEAVRLKEFEHTLYDENKNPDGTIQGGLAFWDQKMYEVISPVVLSRVGGKGGKDGANDTDSQGHNIRLEAERATLLEGKGTVRLYGDVEVNGEDFHITTEDVTYFTSGRRMKSKSPIEVRQYRTNQEGEKETTHLIRGSDSSADLTLKKITIRKNPVMKILNASSDFLASGEGKKNESSDMNITIKADDKLIYDHPARKATFVGDVKVDSGGKTLRCKKLTASIQKGETGTFSVTDIKADGQVWLHHGDFTAMGNHLQWQTVTQTCELKGKDSTVATPDFTLFGSHLTFFRMNNRFQSEGAGELSWSSPPGAAKDEGSQETGLLAGDESGETHISWNEGMTYDRSEHWALFKGSVAAEQGQTELQGEELELQFGPNNARVKKGIARTSAKLIKGGNNRGDIVFTCEQMEWFPDKSTLRLTSGEGEQVHVRTPGQELTTAEVMLDQSTGEMRCAAPGTMTVAESKNPDGEANPSVAVAWQESMKYSRNSPARAFFTGDVEASMGTRTIHSQQLRVKFNESMAPREIIASGEARLSSHGDSTAKKKEKTGENKEPSGTSDENPVSLPSGAGGMKGWALECAEFTIRPGENILKAGSDGKLRLNEDTKGAKKFIRWADRMEYSGKDSSALFVGDVHARVAGNRLSSERLRADFSKSGAVRYVRARKNVDFSGTGQASWDMESDSAEAIFEGDSKLREVIARDNVRVSDQRGELECEFLHLFLEDDPTAKKGSRLSRAIAETDVFVNHREPPESKAYGDKLTWNYDTGLYVLTGDPYARLIRGGTKAKYEKLIINRKTGEIQAPKGSRPGEIQIVPGKN